MKNVTPKTSLILSAKLALVLFATIAAAIGANAATITVTNKNDSGSGSLRQAILDASGGDTIDFAVTGAITLTTDQLTVNKNLRIIGPGAHQLAVQRSTDTGTPSFRIFKITAGHKVTISGLTISGGRAEGFCRG